MSLRARLNERLAKEAERRPWVMRAVEALAPALRDVRTTRRRLARRYLRGDGLEIGALHLPLDVPRAARVRYVDRADVAGLRAEYPELWARKIVDVDVIDDGERLTTVPDASVDFVVANHFIEHTEDPISTLRSHARVLRAGGVLFLAVPDKRHTFDRDRPVTPLEHVVRDAAEGPEWSREAHYDDWVRDIEGKPAPEVHARARELQARGDSIHFHVWTPAAFAEVLAHARAAEDVPLDVEALVPVRHEFIAILRRA